LDTLTRLHIEYLMLFELNNRAMNRVMHSGVLEFVADEGKCYLPFWMMQNLLVEEGALLTIRNASLPRGSFVKFQPHTKNFLDITNPRAVLERSLRNFTCLTQGDVIVLYYNDRNYYLTVLETKPAKAISIVETDISVDFAPPLDYVEPPKSQNPTPIPTPALSIPDTIQKDKGKTPAVEEDDKKKFTAFGGSGYSLKGTPTSTSPMAISHSKFTSSSPSTTSSPSTSFGSNKLVFGGHPAAQSKKLPTGDEASDDDDEDTKKPKFVPFSGKGHSLKE